MKLISIRSWISIGKIVRHKWLAAAWWCQNIWNTFALISHRWRRLLLAYHMCMIVYSCRFFSSKQLFYSNGERETYLFLFASNVANNMWTVCNSHVNVSQISMQWQMVCSSFMFIFEMTFDTFSVIRFIKCIFAVCVETPVTPFSRMVIFFSSVAPCVAIGTV